MLVSKGSMLFAVLIVAHNDELVLGSGLPELSYFLVVLPIALVDLASLLELVSSLAVLLVVLEPALISVSVAVYDLGYSFHLVVHKIALNDLVESLDVELTLSFTLSVDELSYIDVTVSVFESSMAPEVVLPELTGVLLVVKGVDTLAVFFSIDELSLIDTTISLVSNSASMFLAVSKLAFVLDVFVQITEVALAIELIIFELSFVFHDPLQSVLPDTVFFSLLVEIALIVSAVALVDGSMAHSIFTELASKSFPIIKDELGVGSHLDAVPHLPLVDRAIGVGHSSVDEVAMLELSIEGAVFFLPDSSSMRHAFVQVPLIGVSIGVLEKSMAGKTLLEVALELRAVSIEIDSLAIRSAEFIDVAFIFSFLAGYTSESFGLLLTRAQFLSHDQDILFNQYQIDQLFSYQSLLPAETYDSTDSSILNCSLCNSSTFVSRTSFPILWNLTPKIPPATTPATISTIIAMQLITEYNNEYLS